MYKKKSSVIRKYFLLFVAIFFFYCVSSIKAQTVFQDVVKIKKKINLENVIGPLQSIKIDKSGNFILTNSKSAHVKIYNSKGNLTFIYGRKGRGPGEFLRPTSTIRLASGQLLTAGLQGKLSLFTASGDSLIKEFQIELIPLAGIQQIDKNKILLVGINRSAEHIKLLHIFDLSNGHIIKSFFPSPVALTNLKYGGIFSSFSSLIEVDLKNDKIVSVFKPFPTVRVFNKRGKLLKKFDIDLKNFKIIKEVNKRLSVKELNKYMTTFSIFDNIFWLKNETLLLSYYRLTEFKKLEGGKWQYSLASVKPNGNVIFEFKNTPRLMAVHNKYLFFETPEPKTEADLLKAVIK